MDASRLVVAGSLVLALLATASAKESPSWRRECGCIARDVETFDFWKNHAEYVACMRGVLARARERGELDVAAADRELRRARRSACGRRGFTRRFFCAGPAQRTCSDPENYVCVVDDPACTGRAWGWCLSRFNCLDEYPQVCGCDGKTYRNACRLIAAGVAQAHGGPCRASAD